MNCQKHRYTYLYNDTDTCQYCEIDRIRELNTKLLTEKCALNAMLEERVTHCNEAWSEATGGNYPAHAEKIIEALRSSVQFWKDETRRSVESGDLAYAKAMRLYATMVAENEELKETVKQVEQSAINFHEVWGRYRDALHIIAHTGVSGMSWQYDYEKCVNIAKEALEI